MRKALALLGLVLIPLGFGGIASAVSGSDSSGTHSYSLSCDGDSAVFSNTSASGNLRVSGGGNSFILAPGGPGGLLDWEGGWSIEFEDPHGSGNWVPLDSGSEGPDMCGGPPVFPEPPGGVSYTLECAEMDATAEGVEHVFTNTGTVDLRIIVSLAMGTPGYNVPAGESRVIYGPAGSRYELWYEDSTVSGGYRGFGEGNLSECDEPTPEPEPSFTVVCAPFGGGTMNIVTNTGNVPIDVTWELTPGTGPETFTVAPGGMQPIADTTDDLSYVIGWNDGGTFVVLEEGEWSRCDSTQPTLPASEIPPKSECRGTDWYVVHPGPDADGNSHHYRTVIGNAGSVLVPAGSVTNSPHLDVYQGEALIPVGQDLVAGQDDFNGVFELTRPNCTTTGGGGGGGGGGTTTTASPTTAAPTTPAVPEQPSEEFLGANAGEGYVAPWSEIGPGSATFGVMGFAPGEQVVVTLHSTPRGLGTVTADASGNASITFEVLASDGAGEHRVEFTGPSGTFSVPFTLVLPAQSLPETR